jgi:DNA primase small subunit
MKMAVKVMDEGLKEDFGFSHVAWFYSGRRGIHAWVCDEAARALTDPGRSAVAHYFEVRKKGNVNVTTVAFSFRSYLTP